MTLHFFRSKREAFAHVRSIEARKAVEAVHVHNVTADRKSELFLTDAQRLRRDSISAKLAEGANPYEKTKAVDVGGLADDRKKRRDEALAVQQTRSEAAHRETEARWKTELRKQVRKPITLDDENDVWDWSNAVDNTPMITTPDGRTIKDPDMFRCSFCETWEHRSKVTFGRGGLRRGRKLEVTVVAGVEIVREKVIYFSEKVTACPECVLHITPTVHKDGSITNNIRFPERA